ncbi:MAG: glycosyltransferase [Flavobacteriales bacterium]|nr:glycosyltransferase [Flavobacteriales bacterium]
MTRVLYIGDPNSVHDFKWISWMSSKPEFETFLIAQEHEMSLLSSNQRSLLGASKITLLEPIKSYSLWRFWENQASLKTITEAIDKYKIHVVHPLFATPFSLWTRNLPVPSVITSRGSDIHVVLAGLGKGSFLHRIHGKLLLQQFKSAFENAAAITCTSQGQLNKINSVFGTNLKGEIIRTGVNVDEINALQPEVNLPNNLTDKRIIFLPRYIRPIYQTELQIRALAAIPETLKQQLAIVLIEGKKTDSEYADFIKLELENCGIQHHTFESLSQHEMWSMFKLSALTIMTPKTDGTPNSALEAMAARCPLILGSFNYDEDLFSEEFCERMKTDSTEELAQLIENSLSNYPLEKVECAFENASKFGNRPIEMERLHQLYLALAKR